MQTRVCCLYDKKDIRIENQPISALNPDQVLVAIGVGGICGSDLHYYQDGGFGPIQVKEPIILGHEVAGTVLDTGSDVQGLAKGDRVSLNPSRPCKACSYCHTGLFQHCLNMRFLGSAIRFPHEQGAFRDKIVIGQAQCVKINSQTSLSEAACAEPLAVCLHARNQAGDLAGRNVLVTGVGPIGVLCVALAVQAGAAEVVVTDLQNVPLKVAMDMGATKAINMSKPSKDITRYTKDKGHFDVAFECSAAAPAIRSAIEMLRPRGILVQIGVSGDISLPINLLVGKEIVLKGSHRFHHEFSEAVALIDRGEINLRPMISKIFSLKDMITAFDTAADRTRAVKVQLSFQSEEG